MTLKDNINREISFFNNDAEKVSYYPDKGCRFIFSYEKLRGENSFLDKFYIVHLNENNVEISRFSFLSETITYINWKI